MMAASTNPRNQNGNGGENCSNSGSAVENSSRVVRQLKHTTILSVDWTDEEQSILEQGLAKYASDPSTIRYAKVALQLQDKNVRDVAMRCRWMTKKEIGKRRKEDHNMARKNKEKKERVTDHSAKSSSHLAVRPSVPSYALPVLSMENDDGISFEAIGGGTGQMLEQNAHLFNQISANLGSYQVPDNISLFCRARDNILSIMNELNDMPGIMKQMPPLPVKVNEELAISILPRPARKKA